MITENEKFDFENEFNKIRNFAHAIKLLNENVTETALNIEDDIIEFLTFENENPITAKLQQLHNNSF